MELAQVFRGEPESHHADVDAWVNPPDECILEEAGELRRGWRSRPVDPKAVFAFDLNASIGVGESAGRASITARPSHRTEARGPDTRRPPVARSEYVCISDSLPYGEAVAALLRRRYLAQQDQPCPPRCVTSPSRPTHNARDTAHRLLKSGALHRWGLHDDGSATAWHVRPLLYLGVLYHMRDPLLALERLRQVTKTLAILETALEARDDTFPVEVGGIAVK